MALNQYLLKNEVQEFILQHQKTDLTSLILKGSPFQNVSIQEIAQQIEGRKKLQLKAPSLCKGGVLFPPKLNIEQSSSEQTAQYKQNIIKQCTTLVDCTGGFGIDTVYLSGIAQETTHCELNEALSELVSHNVIIFEKKINCLVTNGIDYVLQGKEHFDVVYIDPSRRSKIGKVIALEQSEPNLLIHWNSLLQKCNRLLVKLSPMLDINYLQRELFCIKELHVVSVKNDVKEIIVLAEKEYKGEPQLFASELGKETTFSYTSESELPSVTSTIHKKYIYEPFGALLKANLHDAYAKELTIKKLAYKSNFYVSDTFLQNPLWKTFEIIEQFPFNKKELRKRVGKEPIQVICRNFPLQPEQVQQLLNVKHGGKRFLICTQVEGGKKFCFIAKRILKN